MFIRLMAAAAGAGAIFITAGASAETTPSSASDNAVWRKSS